MSNTKGRKHTVDPEVKKWLWLPGIVIALLVVLALNLISHHAGGRASLVAALLVIGIALLLKLLDRSKK